MAHAVATPLLIGHENGIVLKGKMASLHADLAVDCFDINSFEIIYVEGNAIYIGEAVVPRDRPSSSRGCAQTQPGALAAAC